MPPTPSSKKAGAQAASRGKPFINQTPQAEPEQLGRAARRIGFSSQRSSGAKAADADIGACGPEKSAKRSSPASLQDIFGDWTSPESSPISVPRRRSAGRSFSGAKRALGDEFGTDSAAINVKEAKKEKQVKKAKKDVAAEAQTQAYNAFMEKKKAMFEDIEETQLETESV